MESFLSWILSDDFWLPAGTTFADLDQQQGNNVARPTDLLMVPLYGFLLLLCRWLFEKVIANPLAKAVDIAEKHHTKPTNQPHLEGFYQTCKTPSAEEAEKLALDVGLTSRGVQRWFRRRRNLNRPNLRKKFAEASWRFVFYLFVFTYGLTTLTKSPWFWDTAQCWEGYPRQGLSDSVYYYYMLEGGFYVSLLFTVITDVKRKDFAEQIIHHASTILLILFSYIANFHRIGTLVMAVHDVSDIFLEGAKCFSYAKRDKVADVMFVIFAVTFIVSRLVVYPCVVLHTSVVKLSDQLDYFPSYYFFNVLLMILQALHIFWASIIIRMAIRMWSVGKVEKDARSDVEELTSDVDKNVDQEPKDKKKM